MQKQDINFERLNWRLIGEEGQVKAWLIEETYKVYEYYSASNTLYLMKGPMSFKSKTEVENYIRSI